VENVVTTIRHITIATVLPHRNYHSPTGHGIIVKFSPSSR